MLFRFTYLRQHCCKLFIFLAFLVEIIVKNFVSSTALLDVTVSVQSLKVLVFKIKLTGCCVAASDPEWRALIDVREVLVAVLHYPG